MPVAEWSLVWSEEAEADLLDVWDYLAREASPTVADDRLREIQRLSANLADWPRLGSERADIRAGLRSFAVRPHVIFYWLQDDRVEILRILHGHRDIERIFSENPPI